MDDGLSAYARTTMRLNTTAEQLQLIDLKSVTLSVMLEFLGLASPERYTFTLRFGNAANTAFTVIERNFDPFTFLPSTRANGTLYSYQIRHFTAPVDFRDAQEIAIDTASVNVSVSAFANVLAGIVEPRVAVQLYSQRGFFYSGLTKDDVGGLRYLYSRGNVNLETPPTDVLLAAQNPKSPSGVVDLSQAFNSGSAWELVSVNTLAATNAGAGGAGTQTVGGILSRLGTFIVPYPYGTFVSANVLAGAANAGGTTTTVSNVISQITATGYRGGVDKIQFVNVSRYYDPLLMVTTNGYLVAYDDRVVNTNGLFVTQRLGRLQPHADIVFSAGDIGVGANGGTPFLYGRTFSTGAAGAGVSPFFVKSRTLNTSQTFAGPGIIDPDATGIATGPTGIELVFNKLGPYFQNGGLDGQGTAGPGFVWGSFDGTTNAPVIYPPQTDLRAYARSLFGN
jgi:hypothetical protein